MNTHTEEELFPFYGLRLTNPQLFFLSFAQVSRESANLFQLIFYHFFGLLFLSVLVRIGIERQSIRHPFSETLSSDWKYIKYV